MFVFDLGVLAFRIRDQHHLIRVDESGRRAGGKDQALLEILGGSLCGKLVEPVERGPQCDREQAHEDDQDFHADA